MTMRKQAGKEAPHQVFSRDPPALRATDIHSVHVDSCLVDSKGKIKRNLCQHFLHLHHRLRSRPIQIAGVIFGTALAFITLLSPTSGASSSSSNASTRQHPRIVRLSDTSLQATQKTNMVFGTRKLADAIETSELPMSDKQYDKYSFKSEVAVTGCPYIADWQALRDPRPTCNSMHEIGMRISGMDLTIDQIGDGGSKDVWSIAANGQIMSDAHMTVLKTQVYDHGFKQKDIDKHIRDAMVMNQASSSSYVLDMYSYCGYTHLVESAPKTLVHWIEEEDDKKSSLDQLRVATQIATALRDAHLFHNGAATMAHTDIKADQFLLPAGSNVFKINDFNRCRLLTSKQLPEICPFTMHVKHKGSRSRSPEEYMPHGQGPQTDKIDVFSLGSVFYHMLVGEKPFDKYTLDLETAIQKISTGVQPPLPPDIATSKDPNIHAIIHAMNWARALKPDDRPTSQQLASHLTKQLSTATVYMPAAK